MQKLANRERSPDARNFPSRSIRNARQRGFRIVRGRLARSFGFLICGRHKSGDLCEVERHSVRRDIHPRHVCLSV